MIQAVIFDLDGVIVSTDEYHYQAWKQISDSEGIPFDRVANEKLRGVSRMESLELIISKADRQYSPQQKNELAARKNKIYRDLLNQLSQKDILPGVQALLEALKDNQVKTAIGSSSKNTPMILDKIGLKEAFDTIVDGNNIQKSKPDPEVFLLAAAKLGVSPAECIVIEDAEAGVAAAIAAGMKVMGVGAAALLPGITYSTESLADIGVDDITGESWGS